MRRFIQKTILLFLFIFIIDSVLGSFLERFQKECTGGDSGRISYICEKDTSDILIFGSSRAHYHYNPDIISDSLNLSCFNCGQNGMGAIFFYGLLQLVCERHKPKMIIMDIYPPYDLEKNDNSRYLYLLRPYYGKQCIDSIFWNIDRNERFKMRSKLYSYNSRLFDMLNEYHNEPRLDYKGFLPLKNRPSFIEKTIEKEIYIYDSLKIKYIDKLASFCKNNSISLLFTSSPRYGIETSKAFTPLFYIANKHHILFLNFYNKKGYADNSSLFANQDHLNEYGANVFTKEIVSLIQHSNYLH